MEINEVTAVWHQYEARLDELVRTKALRPRRPSLVVTRSVLDRLRWTLWMELLIGAIVVLLLGAFAADHAREFPVFGASVVLDGYAIAILASMVAQLVALTGIDFDEPVIAIAQKLERLKLLRARTAMCTLMLAPLMWPALAIAGVRGLLNVEPIAAFGIRWIIANMAFGVVVLLAILWLARRYGTSARPAAWYNRFSNSVSGRHARAVTDQLNALLRYEADWADEIADQ